MPPTSFTIEYVALPSGNAPAREFIDSLDDKAAARVDAFLERLRIHGTRMEGKFVKKLTREIFELRVKQLCMQQCMISPDLKPGLDFVSQDRRFCFHNCFSSQISRA